MPLQQELRKELTENIVLIRLLWKLVDRHVVRGGSFGVKPKVKNPSARPSALWVIVLLLSSLKKIRRFKGYCQGHLEFIRGSLPGQTDAVLHHGFPSILWTFQKLIVKSFSKRNIDRSTYDSSSRLHYSWQPRLTVLTFISTQKTSIPLLFHKTWDKKIKHSCTKDKHVNHMNAIHRRDARDDRYMKKQ